MKFIARYDDKEIDVEVEPEGSGYLVRLGDRWLNADFVEIGTYIRSLRLDDGTQFSLVHHRVGTLHEITFEGSKIAFELIDPLAIQRGRREDETGSGGVVKAPMPGRVVRILVEPGAAVRKGAGLLILEAMKMQNEIQAPVDGVVDAIFVESGSTVEGGADLLHIVS